MQTESTQQPVQRWQNTFYFSRYVRPEWEERFVVVSTTPPNSPHTCWFNEKTLKQTKII